MKNPIAPAWEAVLPSLMTGAMMPLVGMYLYGLFKDRGVMSKLESAAVALVVALSEKYDALQKECDRLREELKSRPREETVKGLEEEIRALTKRNNELVEKLHESATKRTRKL